MKIAVLISGGVDSSVALRLLKDQGHQLEAFYLKIWLEDELAFLGTCPWEEDLAYARAVCEQAGVPLHVVSLQEAYWNIVVKYTIDEVTKGHTPSPDILCNQHIKFGAFFQAIDSSFDAIATGHYAWIEHRDGTCPEEPGRASRGVAHLMKAKDPVKDQTYFLSNLSQLQLSRLIFPLGKLTKPEVRALAEKYDFPNKNRKDSQGICFLGKIKFSDFIRHHAGTKVGDLIEFETGEKIAEHEGFWYYTIGQRKGLGLSGGPWFVVKKDPVKNIVYISKNYYTSDKVRNQFDVDSCNWLLDVPPAKHELQVKVRHGEAFYNATLDLRDAHSGTVKIDGNDQGLAAGQFAVFYDGNECLGCGVIAE